MEMLQTVRERRTRADRRRPPTPPFADELLAALESDQIEILFQPQFAVADGRLVGAEALACWRHPQRGRIGGEALFALAARAGLVARLSQHVTRASLAAAAHWPEPLHLSLNVAADDLASGDFAASMAQALEDSRFPSRRLTLEITEQSLVDQLERSAARLQPLADLGVRIALDDFGAGFCNFRYLKYLPIESLKLDRSMAEGIGDDPRDLAVLRAILAMARALELEVTAEGIERQDQLDALTREGCAKWQGFLGGRPMPSEELLELARR